MTRQERWRGGTKGDRSIFVNGPVPLFIPAEPMRLLQHVGRRHAVVHHHLQLARVVAVAEHAHVAPGEDGDALVERRLERRPLVNDRRRLVRPMRQGLLR